MVLLVFATYSRNSLSLSARESTTFNGATERPKLSIFSSLTHSICPTEEEEEVGEKEEEEKEEEEEEEEEREEEKEYQHQCHSQHHYQQHQ